MTENKIIEGLEALLNAIKLTDEQYIYISAEMLAGFLNLINRLKAEKEALIAGQETLQKALARAEAKVESKTAIMETMARCIEIQEKEIERLKRLLAESEAKEIETAKRFYKEGVRDFEKRLKTVYASDKRYDRPNPHTMLSMLFYNICTVAKELTGDAK